MIDKDGLILEDNDKIITSIQKTTTNTLSPFVLDKPKKGRGVGKEKQREKKRDSFSGLIKKVELIKEYTLSKLGVKLSYAHVYTQRTPRSTLSTVIEVDEPSVGFPRRISTSSGGKRSGTPVIWCTTLIVTF